MKRKHDEVPIETQVLDHLSYKQGWKFRPSTAEEREHANGVWHVIRQIGETWSGGPAPMVWADALATLEPGRLQATYLKLRRTAKSCPSIATFRDAFYELDVGPTEEIPDCALCDNTGWVEGEPFVSAGHEYGGARPCACDHGRQRERSKAWTQRTRDEEPTLLGEPGF